MNRKAVLAPVAWCYHCAMNAEHPVTVTGKKVHQDRWKVWEGWGTFDSEQEGRQPT